MNGMKKNVIYVQMKQIRIIVPAAIIILLFLTTERCTAQSQMSYKIGWGVDYLNDQAAVITGTRAGSVSARATYWKNPTFGIGAELYGTVWELENLAANRENYNFGRISIPLSLDVSHILKFDKKSYRLIVSGGPGVSRIKGDSHKEWMPNAMASIENLVYLDKNLAVHFTLMSSSNISQEKTLDGYYNTTARGITSVVHSFQFGLMYKPKWKKIDEVTPRVEPINTTVNNYWSLKQTNVIRPNTYYVFFAHDESTWSYEKSPSGNLEQLYRVKKRAQENPTGRIIITAYASNTDSSDEYNKDLAQRRVDFIKQALGFLAVDNPIKTEVVGKDFGEKYLEAGRRVEIQFID